MADPVEVPTTTRMLKNVLALLFLALGGGWFTVEAGGLLSAVALKLLRSGEGFAALGEIPQILKAGGPVLGMSAAAIVLGVGLWHAGRWKGTLGATFLAIAGLALIFVIPQLMGISAEYRTVARSFAYGYFGLAAIAGWLGLELFRRQRFQDERGKQAPPRPVSEQPLPPS